MGGSHAGGQRKVVVAHLAHASGHAQARRRSSSAHPLGRYRRWRTGWLSRPAQKMRHVFARNKVLFIIPIGHHPSRRRKAPHSQVACRKASRLSSDTSLNPACRSKAIFRCPNPARCRTPSSTPSQLSVPISDAGVGNAVVQQHCGRASASQRACMHPAVSGRE